MLVAPVPGHAQTGVPGGRLESGRDHRASVRAEAYPSVAAFFSKWREAWNNSDAEALARMYTDDAAVRFPGHAIVRGREPLRTAIHAAVDGASAISTADVDFDSNGENALVVARYSLRRDGRSIEGIVTAVLYRAGRGWRLRVHIFDAPEAGRELLGDTVG